MTDAEFIKSLEYCVSLKNCDECKKPTPRFCSTVESKDFLDLINRQKAEIERLQELLKGWKTEAYKVADEKDKLYCEAVERVKTTKAEAIKELGDEIKKLFHPEDEVIEEIDKVVKEKTGEKE